jgi:hypothetical protein
MPQVPRSKLLAGGSLRTNMGYMDRNIATCVDCGKKTDPKAYGVHYEVFGWVEQRRATGGANNIRFKKSTGNIMCADCAELRSNGLKGQGGLF